MKRILKIILISLLLSPIISKAENTHPVIDNPLHDFGAMSNASAEVIQSLIDQGYDVHEVGKYRYNLLNSMVIDRRKDIVVLLIKAGVDVNTVDRGEGGRTALHRAAYKNHPAIAQILIDAGADIEAKDKKYGWAPLHEAASQGSIDVMRILLQAGADPNTRTKTGGTPFMGAVGHAFIPDWDEGKEFNYETKTYEYPYYDERLARGKQSIITSLAMLKLLLEYGADPHAVDNDGNNARDSLYYAQPAPNVKKYLDELGVK